MRTNFPPTASASAAKDSLRRALFMGVLLVLVWTAIAFLPDPGLPLPSEPAQEQLASTVSPPELGDQAANPAVDSPAETVGGTPATDASDAGPVSSVTSAARGLFGPGYMAVIVLLALAGTWALWLRKQRVSPTDSGRLTEVGRFNLGPQQQIRLVRCADEVLLLGVAGSGISLLKAYPADEFPADEAVAAPSAASIGSAFAELAASYREARAAKKLAGANAKSKVAQAEAAANHTATPHPAESEIPDGVDIPEWTIATASAVSDGPDFMHVLRRYASQKTYKANTLYPPTGASN
jgi:flagellar biogenesis protein FliO